MTDFTNALELRNAVARSMREQREAGKPSDLTPSAARPRRTTTKEEVDAAWKKAFAPKKAESPDVVASAWQKVMTANMPAATLPTIEPQE
ncbi:hypothetical protein C8J37_1127 [Rhizobium sp. PP-WC-1G-195]|nr:hypothetical protein C8J37_1127 [Rhizobium sp. PP-WC-1G-195]